MFGFGLFERRIIKTEDRDVTGSGGFKMRTITYTVAVLGFALLVYECVCA